MRKKSIQVEEFKVREREKAFLPMFPVIHPSTYQIMRAKFKNEKERWGRTDAEVRCWTLQKDSRARENEVPSRRASPVSIAQVL